MTRDTAYRIGQIVPSSNTTMETEIPAMLLARQTIRPERFTFHSSRMRMKRVVKEELVAMDRDSDRCAAELSDARVDVLGYACLVAIMSMGLGYHRQSEQRLHQCTQTCLDRSLRPASHRPIGSVEQRVDVALWVANAQGLLGVGRDFFAYPVRGTGQVQGVATLSAMRLKGLQAGHFCPRSVGVFVWHLRVGAPAFAGGACLLRPLEYGTMAFEQRSHARLQIKRWCRITEVPGTGSDADNVSVPLAAKSMLRI